MSASPSTHPPVAAGDATPTGDPAPAAPVPLRVALEVGPKMVFATALDWPGWCRRAKGELAAIDRLLDYAPRYEAVLQRAGLALPAACQVHVVERLPGGSGTEFGAPGVVAEDERRPLDAAEAARRCRILSAAWATFDQIASAAPEALRKGPRGGGRDRSAIVEHVVECDRGYYAPKIGVRRKPFGADDPAALADLRRDMLAVLGGPSDGGPLREGGWTARFALRYITWHVLDHLWEIEDRSQ